MAPAHLLPARHAARRERGLSLIELMVGLVIALVLSLVMFNVFIVSEGQRRTTAAGSDAQQTGSFSSYAIERLLRMGGAGIGRMGIDQGMWGCKLQITSVKPTTEVRVPLPSGLPGPFANIGLTTLYATPVLILNGGVSNDTNPQSQASDALMVMAGTHRSINTWLQLAAATTATPNSVSVRNSIGLQQGDLLLAFEQDPSFPNYTTRNCQMVEATSIIKETVGALNYQQSEDNLGKTILLGTNGSYSPTYTPSTGLVPPSGAYSSATLLANLGQAPLLSIYAVAKSGARGRELQSYDMLTGTVQSLSDGVVNIQAIYGVANAPGTSEISSWQAPVGIWSAATLMNGSAASIANLQLLRAIRISIVTRSALLERESVTTTTRVLVGDTDFAYDLAWTGDDRRYRYREFEAIVPLRNMLLAPNTPTMK